MDVDSVTVKTKTKSKSASAAMMDKAIYAYDDIIYRVYEDKLSITRKDVLKHFHPDKMPMSIKNYIRTNIEFNAFVNHMFDDLNNLKHSVNRKEFLEILTKHATADLKL